MVDIEGLAKALYESDSAIVLRFFNVPCSHWSELDRSELDRDLKKDYRNRARSVTAFYSQSMTDND